jgi:vinculin
VAEVLYPMHYGDFANCGSKLSEKIIGKKLIKIKFPKVGKQTMEDSKDQILKQEMPLAFSRVEESSHLLVGATQIFKNDPTSEEGRKKLLDGARGSGKALSLAVTKAL